MDGVAIAVVPELPGERFFALRRELGVSTFGLNLIRLAPGQRGRIHRHLRQEEVYFVLSGRLTLVVEQEEYELGPMNAARVAADLRRQLINYAPEEPAVLLALGGSAPHEGRDGQAFVDWADAQGAPPVDVPLPEDVPVRR